MVKEKLSLLVDGLLPDGEERGGGVEGVPCEPQPRGHRPVPPAERVLQHPRHLLLHANLTFRLLQKKQELMAL